MGYRCGAGLYTMDVGEALAQEEVHCTYEYNAKTKELRSRRSRKDHSSKRRSSAEQGVKRLSLFQRLYGKEDSAAARPVAVKQVVPAQPR